MSPPDSRRIRPSVLVIATLLLAGSGYAVYRAVTFTPSRSVAEARGDDASSAGFAQRAGGERRARASRASSGGSSGGTYTHHDWSQESELARTMALGLPGPRFWSEAPDETDPQLTAMWRSFAFRRTDPEATPELPFEPTATRARLVEAEGDVAQSPSSCDVRVLPVASGPFNCVVRVMCDGAVLYPNPSQTAGYVPCDIENGRPVRAVDDGHTAGDGDPLVSLDMVAGTVTVEDFDATGARRYRATLRFDG